MEKLPLAVLVVDDDEASRDEICRAVEQRGHECTEAADGKEALRLLDLHAFDLVISDWRMPNVDGLGVLRHVRSQQSGGNYTYFMLLTGMGDREHLLLGMGAGADDYLAKPIDWEELEVRLAAAERVVGSNHKLRRDSEGSFRLARVDALTGVGNRLRMEEDLRGLLAEVARYGKRCALALCDVDFFKRYNDTHGHLAGDDLLRSIAATIQRALRATDHVYRYGGEEFVIAFPEQSVAEATAATERLRAAVAASCGVTVSAGVAESAGASDARSWIAAADAALYRAKDRGRNRVEAA